MTTHPGEARLNDYLDGALDVRGEAAVVEHLGECADCRAQLDGLRRLLASAATLDRSIEPRRDLWPAIEARIDTGAVTDLDGWRERSRGGLWAHRYHLAAAATLLVLVASSGTLMLVRDDAQPAPVASTAGPDARPDASPVRLVSVPGQADYAVAIRELDGLLRAREHQLDPQTAEVVRRNMAIIDQAIREAQAALAADPANGDLTRAVSTAYKTKINLLRRAVEMPART